MVKAVVNLLPLVQMVKRVIDPITIGEMVKCISLMVKRAESVCPLVPFVQINDKSSLRCQFVIIGTNG